MYKIELDPTYDYNVPHGSLNWEEKIRDHVIANFLTDDMIEWLFNNIDSKYLVDGRNIYFQDDEDAMAFRLVWG